jgi:hypothetical protein
MAATDRIVLDASNCGETTFAVTNSGTAKDHAVFELVPEAPAIPGWFTVQSPIQLVAPAATVHYLVTVAVPSPAPAGSYWLRGRVRSGDTAPPGDSSTLSAPVGFDVARRSVKSRLAAGWWRAVRLWRRR